MIPDFKRDTAHVSKMFREQVGTEVGMVICP